MNVPRPRSLKLAVLLCLEVIALNIIFLPSTMNFNFWAFDDQGANLVVQYLIRAGYRPTVGFGYPYGLLPLLFGRIWFDAFGATPAACLAAMALCAALVAWALARIATTARVGLPGIALFVIALPLAIPLPAPNLAHVLEAALLSNALAEQVAARRGRALALAAAAAFTKPSMAYVYGFVLLLLMLWELRRDGQLKLRPLLRVLLPAIVTVAVLGAVLAVIYTPSAVFGTLLPIAGMSIYSSNHFGFFGAGRPFWYFPGVHLAYYVGTVAGFWIGSTVWLLVCGALAARRIRQSSGEGRAAAEVVLCCAILQLSFVWLFFGGFFSWFYYLYLLLIGAAIAATWGPSYRYVACILALMAAVGQKAELSGLYHAWRATAPSPEMANLWASPAERSEWTSVLGIVQAARAQAAGATMLDVEGGAELLFPGFEMPVSLYLVPGLATQTDISRKLTQLSDASVVVIPAASLNNPVLSNWPVFRRALDQYRMIWKGDSFQVYRRTRMPGAATLPSRRYGPASP